MAEWETTSNDVAATDETNGDTSLDTTSLTGAITEIEQAEFRSRANEAGWAETVPVKCNIQQNSRDEEATRYAADSAVYEWSDDYGEVGPEVSELEEQLYHGGFRLRQGDHMDNLRYEVTVEGPDKIQPARSFDAAGLHPIVREIITQKMGYSIPTPVQAYTIPAVLNGSDVIAVAQTGSGKTAAYLIPIISRLCGKAKQLQAPRPGQSSPDYSPWTQKVKAEPLVVIVVPTHELAVQVFDECRRLCYRTMLRPFAAYGGQPYGITYDQLGKGCDILVATPGRLCDLMRKPDVLSMSRVLYTVVDEADEMLTSDWESELGQIMAGGDTNDDGDHLYLMFSATFPRELRALARQYMASDHYRLTVGRNGSSHKNIHQDVILVDGNRKLEACFDLLYASEPVRTLIFCNSKRTVDELDAYLYQRYLLCTSIHSDRGQREREDSMRAFRSGRAPILIATGVSARGLDVAGVEHVINYDLPSMAFGGIQEHVHRIGRTARIGHTGKATSFYNERRDEDIAQALVNQLVEMEQEVPEFLAHLVPEGGVVNFDDESEDEENNNEEDGGVGFGSVDPAAASTSGDFGAASVWGAAAPAESVGFTSAASGTFTADGGDAAAASACKVTAWHASHERVALPSSGGPLAGVDML